MPKKFVQISKECPFINTKGGLFFKNHQKESQLLLYVFLTPINNRNLENQNLDSNNKNCFLILKLYLKFCNNFFLLKAYKK